MIVLIEILSGIAKAIGCFSLVLGASLIFDYSDRQARAHKHKTWQSAMLIVAALGCLYPAYTMIDGLFVNIEPAEKAAFIIVGILCAITYACFFMNMADRDR